MKAAAKQEEEEEESEAQEEKWEGHIRSLLPLQFLSETVQDAKFRAI